MKGAQNNGKHSYDFIPSLIGCFCIVVLSWAVVAIQTVINDFKREKREEKKAAQDDEYHIKRMEALK